MFSAAYVCGLLGHTCDTCDIMAANDGVRPWEPEIRADVRRAGGGGGGGGRSRWLRGEGESHSKWINND